MSASAANTATVKIRMEVDDTASVKIRQLGDESQKAGSEGEKAFKRSGKSLSAYNSEIEKTVSQLKSMVAVFLSFVGLQKISELFLGIAKSFESYQTSLETITGSSEKAKKSMLWILEFTAKTPYELDQVTQNFVKLKAYGIDPVNGVMRTLGDTASAMSKPLGQAVEMFADAITGEFERLKEFGIRAKTQGDQVTFSWLQNGIQMQKTVEKTGNAIQTGLIDILENRFAGAMEKQSRTFAGMWSNITDHFTIFRKKVMDAGVFEHLKNRAQEALDVLNKAADDGTMEEWANKLSASVTKAAEALTGYVQKVRAEIESFAAVMSDLKNNSIVASIGKYGLIGYVMLGTGAGRTLTLIASAMHTVNAISNTAKGLGLAAGGTVSWAEVMSADFEELKLIIDNFDKGKDDPFYLMQQRLKNLHVDLEKTQNRIVSLQGNLAIEMRHGGVNKANDFAIELAGLLKKRATLQSEILRIQDQVNHVNKSAVEIEKQKGVATEKTADSVTEVVENTEDLVDAGEQAAKNLADAFSQLSGPMSDIEKYDSHVNLKEAFGFLEGPTSSIEDHEKVVEFAEFLGMSTSDALREGITTGVNGAMNIVINTVSNSIAQATSKGVSDGLGDGLAGSIGGGIFGGFMGGVFNKVLSGLFSSSDDDTTDKLISAIDQLNETILKDIEALERNFSSFSSTIQGYLDNFGEATNLFNENVDFSQIRRYLGSILDDSYFSELENLDLGDTLRTKLSDLFTGINEIDVSDLSSGFIAGMEDFLVFFRDTVPGVFLTNFINNLIHNIGLVKNAYKKLTLETNKLIEDTIGGSVSDKLREAGNFRRTGAEIDTYEFNEYAKEQLMGVADAYAAAGLLTDDYVAGLSELNDYRQIGFYLLAGLSNNQEAYNKVLEIGNNLTETATLQERARAEAIRDTMSASLDGLRGYYEDIAYQMSGMGRKEWILSRIEDYKDVYRSVGKLTEEQFSEAVGYVSEWATLAMQKEKEAANLWLQVADRVKNLSTNIEDTILNLKYGNLNVSVGTTKTAMATEDYAELLAAAKSGDEEAISRYLSFVPQYLQVAQDTYNSSESYRNIYNRVMADLSELNAFVQSDDYSRLLYDASQEELTESRLTNEQLLSIRDSLDVHFGDLADIIAATAGVDYNPSDSPGPSAGGGGGVQPNPDTGTPVYSMAQILREMPAQYRNLLADSDLSEAVILYEQFTGAGGFGKSHIYNSRIMADYSNYFTGSAVGSVQSFLAGSLEKIADSLAVYTEAATGQSYYFGRDDAIADVARRIPGLTDSWTNEYGITNFDMYNLPGYADGGVISRDHVARLHAPEAVVPLKGGSIPVDIRGGGSQPPEQQITIVIGKEVLDAQITGTYENMVVKASKRGKKPGRIYR